MKRRFSHFVAAAILIAIANVALASSASAEEPLRRPNVVLVAADDLGPHLHCYGDTVARTPNLDRLAGEGIRFDRAYVTQASCSPSRSSLLTGLFPHQNGQMGLAPLFRVRDGIHSLPEMLHDLGYRTGVIGKLHVAGSLDEAFDVRPPKGERPSALKSQRDPRELARVIDAFFAEPSERPFFLLVNLIDPHRPFMAQVAGVPPSPIRGEAVHAFPFLGIDSDTVRQTVADYYNGVERMDLGVGVVRAALEERGLLDDTILVFLGDHGPGFTRAKTTCYEAGTRIPLILRWPRRVSAGSSSDAFVSLIDVFPTIAEGVGAPVPAGLAGASLFSLVGEHAPGWRDAIFTEFEYHGYALHVPRRAVRVGDMKLIVNLKPGIRNPAKGIDGCVAWDESRKIQEAGDPVRLAYATYDLPPPLELYDLAADPGELVNRADDPRLAPIREELLARVLAWQKATNDSALVPSPR